MKSLTRTIPEGLSRLRASLPGSGPAQKYEGGETPLRSELFSTARPLRPCTPWARIMPPSGCWRGLLPTKLSSLRSVIW